MAIWVTGGGPAGVATAIGLARFGFRVALLAGAPRRPWLEGLSLRTGEALESAGCSHAAAMVGEAAAQVHRHVVWGSLRGEVNREALVDRAAFDAALQRDAVAAGVEVIRDGLLRGDPLGPSQANRDAGSDKDHERAENVENADSMKSVDRGWTLRTRSGRLLRARYWVDARGRSTPRGRGRVRGVATLALAIRCAIPGGSSLASALVAGERGYFWIAARADDALVQWFRDPQERGAGPLSAEVEAELTGLRRASGPAWLAGLTLCDATPSGARDATPFWVEQPIGATHIRVGDAASTTDPLSGQGVFSALAMARAASACVQTQLRRPGAAELAQRFYRARVRSIFWRNRRKAAEFYREEARWAEAPFWSRRRHIDCDETATTPDLPQVATRPVVCEGFVQTARVVCTPEDPEGVWRLNGVPVVALLECPSAPAAALAERFAATESQIEAARAWLRSWGLSGSGEAARKRAERLTAPHPIPQSGGHG